MLIFLKLGGSLITHKQRPHTARLKLLSRLASEISLARQQNPNLQIIIGHGSGSFGHYAANKHKTRQGVFNPNQWLGFAEVWQQARELNQIVVAALLQAGLPVIAFPPSAVVTSNHGQIQDWNINNIQSALNAGLIPLVYGDVIFDSSLGGTILSTEELFFHLASRLNPERILLAGLETGVWQDFPQRRHLIPEITEDIFQKQITSIKGSNAVDVTGGMYDKVNHMIKLTQKIPNLQVLIFSGSKPDTLFRALIGENPGTLIHH